MVTLLQHPVLASLRSGEKKARVTRLKSWELLLLQLVTDIDGGLLSVDLAFNQMPRCIIVLACSCGARPLFISISYTNLETSSTTKRRA
jgi:hypothetical protein